MKKSWLVYDRKDKYDHFCCCVRPLFEHDNIASIVCNIPGIVTANVVLTKKLAYAWANNTNDIHRKNKRYMWDFMDDGKTPAPF